MKQYLKNQTCNNLNWRRYQWGYMFVCIEWEMQNHRGGGGISELISEIFPFSIKIINLHFKGVQWI